MNEPEYWIGSVVLHDMQILPLRVAIILAASWSERAAIECADSHPWAVEAIKTAFDFAWCPCGKHRALAVRISYKPAPAALYHFQTDSGSRRAYMALSSVNNLIMAVHRQAHNCNYAVTALIQARLALGGTAAIWSQADRTYLRALGPNLAFSPEWRTSTAVALALGIYNEKAFDRMPYLADALQDAGCEHDTLLGPLRSEPDAHTRADWVLCNLLGLNLQIKDHNSGRHSPGDTPHHKTV